VPCDNPFHRSSVFHPHCEPAPGAGCNSGPDTALQLGRRESRTTDTGDQFNPRCLSQSATSETLRQARMPLSRLGRISCEITDVPVSLGSSNTWRLRPVGGAAARLVPPRVTALRAEGRQRVRGVDAVTEVSMRSGNKRRSSHVPGQFLGYSLQTTRATMRLLEARPGSFVSVEVLDDVAVTNRDGTATAEQTKSATSSNPLADRSPEWWKTLATWVRAAQSDQLNADSTSFELFVSKKRPGTLVHTLAAASDEASAAVALAEAKKALWGDSPHFTKRAKVASTIAPHAETIFAAKDEIATKIVARLSLVFGTGSSKADLVNLLKAKIISDDMLDVVAHQMLGWVKTAIDGHIEKSRPAVVSADDFNTELIAFVRRVDRFAILNSFAPTTPKTALSIDDQGNTYVRQLDIIGADYDTKLKAANDFLRASVDRSVWATKGLVHRSSFDEFEEVLTRAWNAKKQIVAIQSAEQAPEVCGRFLYSECSLVQSPLEGRSVPPHFTPGCYHALANSFSVGWHPDFKSVLTSPTRGTKKDPAA
jgi:hypothetical protein